MGQKVSVTCLRRRGIRIGNYRNADIELGVGRLVVEEVNDSEMKRAIKMVRLLDSEKRPPDQLVPLRDVTLLWLKDDRMVIAGIERVADRNGPCEYAQTWLCEWLTGAQNRLLEIRGNWPSGYR